MSKPQVVIVRKDKRICVTSSCTPPRSPQRWVLAVFLRLPK